MMFIMFLKPSAKYCVIDINIANVTAFRLVNEKGKLLSSYVIKRDFIQWEN